MQIVRVDFLPLGADFNTAVYRLETMDSTPYFLKIRKGIFEENSVLIPRFLYDQGIRQIMTPLKTIDDQLWINLDTSTCILYPFVEGSSGFEKTLSNDQWKTFGTVLKSIHTAVLPPELKRLVPSETYSPNWREMVREFQELVAHSNFEDPVASKMAAFMRSHHDDILFLIERAGQLGRDLKSQPLEQVLCHSDIHAGNLLLTAHENLFIVDWDNPILSPKERDLMFIGGGVGGTWNSEEEVALFFQGYGTTDIHLTALTYYRYERIIQDIAEFCEQILLAGEGDDDREQGFQWFINQFSPNGVIEIALQTDQKLKEG